MSDQLIGRVVFGPPIKVPTAAAAAVPTNFQILTIGGPRSAETIQREIDACERCLEGLRAELRATLDGGASQS